MQLGAKRAVDARATLLLGRGWCKTQNAHETRPRPSFRGQKAVAHVVWTQILSIVLPSGQMAKCENCDSVHWQRQQSSVQVREPETGVEKVKRKCFNAQALKCLQSSVSKFSYCVQMCVCILRFQSVLASVFANSNCCALVLSSMSYDRKMNSVFTCIF